MMKLCDEGLLDEGLRKDLHPLRPLPPLAFVCAVAAWLIAIGAFFISYDPQRPIPEGLEAGVWTFEATEDAKQGAFGFSVAAHAFKDGSRYDVRVLYDGPRFMARERFEGYATFEGFSEEKALRFAQQGLVADARMKQEPHAVAGGFLAPVIELRSWASSLFDGFQTRGAALMRALLTGDRVDLERDGLYNDMKAVGLAHMVAVSGSHLCVVAAMAGFVMKTLGIRRRACALALCVFYAIYAVFTGLSAPVIRAAVMSSVVVLSVWARRRSSALAALSVCVCVLIALNPYNALSLSFFLSAASTFGVIVFAPLFTSWALRAGAGRCRSACEAFALTAAAGLPMTPVTVAVFARLSLVAPFANFVAAPVFAVLLTVGLVALPLAALLPSCGAALLSGLSGVADTFCAVSSFVAHIPCSSVPVAGDVLVCAAASVAGIAALWMRWPHPSAAAIRLGCVAAVCVAAALSFALPQLAGDEVVMLDVGQGDAVLIRSQGACMLVDTGNKEQKLLSALGRQGVVSLDAVAISHHDDDHCGCLELLAPTISGCVLLSEETFLCGCNDCRELEETAARTVGKDRLAGIAAGDTVRIGRFSCTAVWPLSFEEEGGNADSLCFLVRYDAQEDGIFESSLLLTGDAEAEQIEAMMDAADVDSVDVVKAGHHGSKAGVADGFSERVGAEAVLVSVGAGNRYGHPSKEALEEFESGGMEVFRTDEQGDVTCRFEGSGISVSTQRGEVAP